MLGFFFEVSVKISCVHWLFSPLLLWSLKSEEKSYQELDIVCFFKVAALSTFPVRREWISVWPLFVMIAPVHHTFLWRIRLIHWLKMISWFLYCTGQHINQEEGLVLKLFFVLFFYWELKLITDFRHMGINSGCGDVFFVLLSLTFNI